MSIYAWLSLLLPVAGVAAGLAALHFHDGKNTHHIQPGE